MQKCAKTLGMPVILTEQLPFENTCAEIKENFSDTTFSYQKTQFSMITPEVQAQLMKSRTKYNVRTIFIVGIEAHICVLQTVLKLRQMKFNVQVIVDGVSSQHNIDRKTALKQMEASGAILTTAETAVYTILKDAAHPKFRSVLPFIKEYSQFKQSEISAKL